MKATFAELIQRSNPTLIDFSAEWCGPCKMMVPILAEVKTAIGGKASIIKIDIDKNPQIASSYQIQSVPTLMLFKNGKVMWRQSGVMTTEQLKSVINQYT
jgi:thioredoxin 1